MPKVGALLTAKRAISYERKRGEKEEREESEGGRFIFHSSAMNRPNGASFRWLQQKHCATTRYIEPHAKLRKGAASASIFTLKPTVLQTVCECPLSFACGRDKGTS